MRILANYGYKTNGDTYSVTFETIGDVPSAQASQTVDELFQLAKGAGKRQLAYHETPAQPQPIAVTIPQPVPPHVNGSATQRPVASNGQGTTPKIKQPGLPATTKQLGLLRRLAQERGQALPDLTDLTMGEASSRINTLLAR